MATSSRGAEGVKGKDGKEEMIDKPMVLQASGVAVLCVDWADFAGYRPGESSKRPRLPEWIFRMYNKHGPISENIY